MKDETKLKLTFFPLIALAFASFVIHVIELIHKYAR